MSSRPASMRTWSASWSTARAVRRRSSIAAPFEPREYPAAVREIMTLADRANGYVDRHKPWLAAKDPARAAEVQAVCTQALNLFRILMIWLKPVMPRMAEQAEAFLGAPVTRWSDAQRPLLDAPLGEYQALATRIDGAQARKMLEE